MMLLTDILKHVSYRRIVGDPEGVVVSGICIDSRKAASGSLFIAIRGSLSDGHSYIPDAVKAGAKVIFCEALPLQAQEAVCYVQLADTAASCGLAAAVYFENPSRDMAVVGITGTNGKTTIATLLYQLFSGLGYTCGLISTVENKIGAAVEASTHTTPDAISIQSLLARMKQAGCSHVFMEVSSHAVHQQRIAGIRFSGAVFSNITHDHLDYHQTFDAYIQAKKAFFDHLPKESFALTNIDDRRGGVMLQNTAARRYTYSLLKMADFKGKILENNLSGLVMYIEQEEIHFRMAGSFNASNLIAVYGTARLLGEEKQQILPVLSNLTGAPGRFEIVYSSNEKVLGIVDYAHTPDALINITGAINQLRKNGQALITVIGCGGDRDKAKRPLMAAAAAKNSDRTVLTSDNPRSEDPEVILDEMEAGLPISLKRKILRITDRKEAIRTACVLAQPGDVVLVAGKGHEAWQEINGKKYPFDDKMVLKEVFELLNK